MPVIFWNPTLANERIMSRAVEKLDDIAQMMADEVRKEIRTKQLIWNKNRPAYRSGRYAGRYWTARYSGALLRSVRVTKQDEAGAMGHRNHNVWILCGNTQAYYGKIVEHYTPFFRPAINRAKRQARTLLNAA